MIRIEVFLAFLGAKMGRREFIVSIAMAAWSLATAG
jgi:hypothetical protein